MVSLIVANLIGNVWLAYRFRGGGYEAEGRALSAPVEPGTRVMGDTVWWRAFRPQHTFFDDGLLYAHLYADRQRNVADASDAEIAAVVAKTMRQLRPNYVLLDDGISCFLSDRITPALAVYLDSNCTLVGQVAGAWVDDPAMRTLQLGQQTKVFRCPA